MSTLDDNTKGEITRLGHGNYEYFLYISLITISNSKGYFGKHKILGNVKFKLIAIIRSQ